MRGLGAIIEGKRQSINRGRQINSRVLVVDIHAEGETGKGQGGVSLSRSQRKSVGGYHLEDKIESRRCRVRELCMNHHGGV